MRNIRDQVPIAHHGASGPHPGPSHITGGKVTVSVKFMMSNHTIATIFVVDVTMLYKSRGLRGQ